MEGRKDVISSLEPLDISKLAKPRRPSSLQLSSDTVSPLWTPSSVLPTEKPISLAQKSLAQQVIRNKSCRKTVSSYYRSDESPIASLEKIWEENKTDDNDSIKTASPKRRSFAGLTSIGRSENNLVKSFWKKRFFCIRRRSVPDKNCVANAPPPAIIEER